MIPNVVFAPITWQSDSGLRLCLATMMNRKLRFQMSSLLQSPDSCLATMMNRKLRLQMSSLFQLPDSLTPGWGSVWRQWWIENYDSKCRPCSNYLTVWLRAEALFGDNNDVVPDVSLLEEVDQARLTRQKRVPAHVRRYIPYHSFHLRTTYIGSNARII